jgi:hypothetical protein
MKKHDEDFEKAKKEFSSALKIFIYFVIFFLIYALLKSIIPNLP